MAVKAAAVGVAVAAAYLPGFILLRVQAGRVLHDYWIPELRWRTFWGTFSEFLIPTHGFDFLLGGQVVCAVAATSVLIVAFRGRRGDYLVVCSVVVPMLLAAAVSTAQPIWVARYFRFAHLFLLTAVALAIVRTTRRALVLRGGLLTLLFAILLGANVAFWRYLDIPNGGGVRQAVATILAERRGREMIVAFDHHQYVTAKYYVGSQADIRLVEPRQMFWGWHLVRPGDLISREQLHEALARGVWVISTGPAAWEEPELATADSSPVHEFRYYFSLHRQLYVQRFMTPSSRVVRLRKGRSDE
jgi:hypothetical protein